MWDEKLKEQEEAAPSSAPQEESAEENLPTEDVTIPSQKEATTSPQTWRHMLFEITEMVIFSLVAVGILFACFFRTAGVEGASMETTLQNGDYLLLYRFFYTPERGDIVVVNRYHEDSTRVERPLIKRVIAVAGDTISVTSDAVYLNGEKLDEPYVHYKNNPTMPTEITVPEGKLFVMGDHRDESKDSRMIGFVDVDDVMGKAVLRLMPYEKFGGLYD